MKRTRKGGGPGEAFMLMPSSWGTLRLRAMNDRVVECEIPVLRAEPGGTFRWGVARAPSGCAAGCSALRNARAYIRSVFRGRPGRRPQFAWPAGTPFERRVWKALLAIPPGKTLCYRDVARRVRRPGGARAVGRACAAKPLPLFIPCHRDLPADGGLGGFSPGRPWKRWLLEQEARAHRQPAGGGWAR